MAPKKQKFKYICTTGGVVDIGRKFSGVCSHSIVGEKYCGAHGNLKCQFKKENTETDEDLNAKTVAYDNAL